MSPEELSKETQSAATAESEPPIEGIPAAATTVKIEGSDAGESNEKRKIQGDNSTQGTKPKYMKQHHTWRKEKNSGENKTDGSGHPHGDPTGGSFASSTMREMFGVHIPPHLLPPTTPAANGETENKDDKTKQPRITVKRKIAFLLAYVGSGYSGFQVNPGTRSLQADFELALLKGGFLSPMNFGFPHKYGWSTSGRTDRGVHACAQVCSAKLELVPGQTMQDVRELINQHLPETFRVLDVIRTSRSFHAKTGRDRVRYQYMIPSFCFFPREQLRDILLKAAPLDTPNRRPQGPLSTKEVKEIQTQLKGFRISNDQKEAVQKALKKYCGTHKFHNFTKGVKACETRANRYIVSFNVEDPVVFENGIEWIPTQVTGQSFLLHQIRKMVSLAVDSVRLPLPEDIIETAFRNEGFKTGLAPAQGLFLEMSFYDQYNRRQGQNPDLDDLKWDNEGSDAHERWKKFRNEVIMNHVVNEEQDEGNFVSYLYLQEFFFEQDDYSKANGSEIETVR